MKEIIPPIFRGQLLIEVLLISHIQCSCKKITNPALLRVNFSKNSIRICSWYKINKYIFQNKLGNQDNKLLVPQWRISIIRKDLSILSVTFPLCNFYL